MLQITGAVRVAIGAMLLVAAGGVSAQEEERPDWRTTSAELRVDRDDDRHRRDEIEGVVADITRAGDDIFLRAGGRTIRIEANRGVKVWYRGQSYRVRDLERGDVVRVELQQRSGDRYRARSVEVLRSVSHDRRGGWGDRRYERLSSIEGRVVSLDLRYEEMVVRVDRRDLLVDLGQLRGGRRGSELRSVRVGDSVRIDGWLQGSVFVADSLYELRGRRW